MCMASRVCGTPGYWGALCGAIALGKAPPLPRCLTALAYIHSLDLIHCDLKPENVLIKSLSRCIVKVRLLRVSFPASCAPQPPTHASHPLLSIPDDPCPGDRFWFELFHARPALFVRAVSLISGSRGSPSTPPCCRLDPASRVWACP